MTQEKRYLPISDCSLRATDEGGKRVLVGYAAVFDKRSLDLGGFQEVIKPGAFKRALAEKQDVRALVDHDSSRVLGRTTSGTLLLSEDDIGLRYQVALPDTGAGRDIYESVKRGDVSGSSFAFLAKGEEWGKADGKYLRTVTDADLFDVSPVTYPAYPDTDVAVRSLRAAQDTPNIRRARIRLALAK